MWQRLTNQGDAILNAIFVGAVVAGMLTALMLAALVALVVVVRMEADNERYHAWARGAP